MQLKVLLPEERSIELEELPDLVAASAAIEPFDESIVNVAIELSRRIFQDEEARKYPELLALAYWMRKTEIVRLAAQFRSLQLEDRVLVPRGLIFHLPPRNVDTIFVYSWLLAALTGNRSIIRLSPQRSGSTSILLRLLRETLATAVEPARTGTIIVSYGHEEEPTALLSAMCDARVIWGGDQTVEIIRRSPIGPSAREITFPDRYSLSVIKTDAYLGLSEKQRESLAHQFFNDAFWFDQMACSSPRLVVWCGTDSEARTASTDFFSRVAGRAEHQHYFLPPAVSMQKLVFTCSAIITSPVEECQRYKDLTVMKLTSLTGFSRNHPGGGLFFNARLDTLLDLASFISRKDQTLTWFGFAPAELHALVRRLNGRAIDRIVPIGRALQFHRFWDGYDLLQEFCRCVHVDSAPVGGISSVSEV